MKKKYVKIYLGSKKEETQEYVIGKVESQSLCYCKKQKRYLVNLVVSPVCTPPDNIIFSYFRYFKDKTIQFINKEDFKVLNRLKNKNYVY